MTVDRALLLYLLSLAEPHGLLSDVKLQQLGFLCELQMFDKRVKGFHLEFVRYAYGAFSRELDNDLMSLRRKERIENFSVSEKGAEALAILLGAADAAEPNRKILELMQAVIAAHGPEESSAITRSVERVEVSTPDRPEFRLAIEHVSFHSILLVPSRIEVDTEFTLPGPAAARLNAALGY